MVAGVIQRKKNARTVLVHLRKRVTDSRGNTQYEPSTTTITVPAWIIPVRSYGSDIAGQQGVYQARIGFADGLFPINADGNADFGLWTEVEFDNQRWKVETPPVLHYGTPSVRHWTVDLRRSPGG